jgi:mRNA-degrading endonuclease toxin of MazEF toxin-antitoxin module
MTGPHPCVIVQNDVGNLTQRIGQLPPVRVAEIDRALARSLDLPKP